MAASRWRSVAGRLPPEWSSSGFLSQWLTVGSEHPEHSFDSRSWATVCHMSVDLGGCHCCMSPVLHQARPKRVRAPVLCWSHVTAGTVLPYRLAAQQRGRSLCPAASSRRSPLPWQGARPAGDSFSTAPVRCYRAVGSERRLRRKTRICWSVQFVAACRHDDLPDGVVADP